MAELKKNAIKKAIKSIEKSYDYHSYNGKYDVLVDLDELVDLIVSITTPTTTEAEIRAMAISDFLQFVYDNASNEEYANEDGWAMSDLIDLEFKYLEQLKEE